MRYIQLMRTIPTIAPVHQRDQLRLKVGTGPRRSTQIRANPPPMMKAIATMVANGLMVNAETKSKFSMARAVRVVPHDGQGIPVR